MNYDINEFEKNYNSPEKIRHGEEEIEEGLWNKLERVGKKINFAKDVKALYKYMRDTDVPWYRKSIVIGALIYFISPIDTIPDLVPLVGYLDDLGVIMAVLKFMGSELIPYYER
jgi:uncharacterized membrane protein YkvA (DUF1232 family)